MLDIKSDTKKDYDLVIIGTGSAGLPAGMYAGRYKIKNVIIGSMPGGALATSHCVENYPGILSASGGEIMQKFQEHAQASGSDVILDFVTKIEQTDDQKFAVHTQMNKMFVSQYVLIATGNKYRHLGVPGEDTFLGGGVSYCATCDGMFFRNKEVAIVGGGDTAVTEALYLAEICKTVHILVRKDCLRAETVWVEKAKKNPNILIHFHTQVEEICGEDSSVTHLKLNTGKKLPVEAIFIAIGSDPDTSLIDHFYPKKDESGCLQVNERQQTNVLGLYAAGDVTTNSNKFKQTIMSAAEGALAAHSIHEDILRKG